MQPKNAKLYIGDSPNPETWQEISPAIEWALSAPSEQQTRVISGTFEIPGTIVWGYTPTGNYTPVRVQPSGRRKARRDHNRKLKRGKR